MQKGNYMRVGLFMGLVLLLPSLMRCQCEPPDYCDIPSDCVGKYWINNDCTEEEGYWACVDHTCTEKCGEIVCNSSSDCLVATWPADIGCESDEGVWECRDSSCVAVCNNGECAQDSECSEKPWPGDAGCAESEGHWECQSSSCVAVCDSPECKVAEDCASNTWPEIACSADDGYWECQGGECVAMCNPQQCTQNEDCSGNTWPGDVGCEETAGHWKCQDGDCLAVCDTQCTENGDCDGQQWPTQEVDCAQEHGHWECQDGACTAVCNAQCDDAAGCSSFQWGVDCLGHWDCVLGFCNEVCDEVGCGDDECDEMGGETVGSCPEDCGLVCALPMDCTGEEWILPCDGRWECTDSTCVGVCDYTSCGNGTCDNDNGESSTSCPDDCMTNCQLPIDCIHNTWTQLCQGLWSCYLGQCKQVCESNSCGDGVCSPEAGETGTSCYKDCHAGACTELGDCTGLPWLVDCDGKWTCDAASGSCMEDCEGTDCDDGVCDVLGGEDTGSCAADCSDYVCSMNDDCSALTLPEGCSGWMCVNQVCVPTCQ